MQLITAVIVNEVDHASICSGGGYCGHDLWVEIAAPLLIVVFLAEVLSPSYISHLKLSYFQVGVI